MKGYIPVEIPTKRYIRAFIINQLGEKPYMRPDNVIGNKFYDLLQHTTNTRKNQFASKHYNTKIRVYISLYTFRTRGANLNETNVKNFNGFMQSMIKERVRFLLDFFVPEQKSFEKGLLKVRMFLKIEDEDWDTESIKKDYYRYRLKKHLPLLYQKNHK